MPPLKLNKMSKDDKKATSTNVDKKAIATDVAVNELKEFLKIHLKKEFRRGLITDEKIQEDYPDVIEALEDGLLTFDDKMKPSYKLRYPLFEQAENKDLVVKQVTFRQRLKGADKSVLLNGLNPQKELGTYIIKTVSYITQLSITEVKELEKDDFETLNQLCSVF